MTTAPSMHDPVTRLPSRALLREHARLAVARAQRHDREVAVLHVGLDDFGLVNDSLGRDAGDAVLREAGARMRRSVAETHVVARSGGDEFCVLLADLGSDAEEVAETVAGQVLATLTEPFAVADQSFEVGATVGGSMFPRDCADEHTLLKHADAAMRQAKDNDRGGLLFYSGGTSEALERLLITGRLRGAVDRDEMELHFQPIYDLRSGEVVAAEALLRWQDPERGTVPPLRFIPVAEHTGLIERIGEWVVDAACAQARAWQDEGLDLTVTLNVSLRQFRDDGFAKRLGRRLAQHDVRPSTMVVEITETTAMREPRCVEPVLDELRELGVRVAIDDFGVGYSSLGRLRDMAVDILKIDGGFLPRGPDDEQAAGFVRAALQLVDALGLTAVLEGVETEEQYRFVVASGCPFAQGFHLAHPMAPADLGGVLADAGRRQRRS